MSAPASRQSIWVGDSTLTSTQVNADVVRPHEAVAHVDASFPRNSSIALARGCPLG